MNAGVAAGVNVQRPQRASAWTNDVEAREARRRLSRARDHPVMGFRVAQATYADTAKDATARTTPQMVVTVLAST